MHFTAGGGDSTHRKQLGGSGTPLFVIQQSVPHVRGGLYEGLHCTCIVFGMQLGGTCTAL